ncbi:hypothetical protein MJK72_21065 [Klebsiella pneumoniae]|nr:hypothetical protein MJK72_21065 [Klebsiella pneumoniae]
MKDKPSLDYLPGPSSASGSPNKAGSEESHGAVLGEKEVALARQQLGWKYSPFEIPKEIYAGWDARPRGEKAEHAWNEKFAAYQQQFPELAAELTRRMNGALPEDFCRDRPRLRGETVGRAGENRQPQGFAKRAERLRPVLPGTAGRFCGSCAE